MAELLQITSTRIALASEIDQVFLMGADIWALGSEADYLATCHANTKYKEGTWYILSKNDQLVSSLVVYKFAVDEFGFGSIATPPPLQKMGYASILINDVIAKIEAQRPSPNIFLYSDIDPHFYEKFNFVSLPPKTQKYKTTTCMVRSQTPETYFHEIAKIPDYF